MTIRVNGPDGIVINFPDGTDEATIDRVMREAVAGKEPEAASEPETQGEQTPNIGHKGDMVAGDRIKPDLTTSAAHGILSGFSDEIAGGVGAIVKPIENFIKGEGPLSPIENYHQTKARADAMLAAAREEYPVGSDIAEVAGAVVGPGFGVKAAMKAPTVLGRMTKGAGAGLAGSAAYQAGTGETLEERIDNVLSPETLIGGAVGAAIPGGAAAIKALRRVNKLDVFTPESASRYAARYEPYKAQKFNFKNVKPEAPKGMVAAMRGVGKELNTEIASKKSILEDIAKADPDKKQILNAAIQNPQKHTIESVEKAFGDTAEGKDIVRLLEEKANHNMVVARGVRGGISPWTDSVLNPLPINIGGGNKGGGEIAQLGRLARVAMSTGHGLATGGWSTAGQFTGMGITRAIDKLTGRKSLPKLFIEQNAKKLVEKAEAAKELPSIQAARAQALQRKEAEKRALDAERVAIKESRDNKKKLTEKLKMLANARRVVKQISKETEKAAPKPKAAPAVVQKDAQGKRILNQEAYEAGKQRIINTEAETKRLIDSEKDAKVKSIAEVALKRLSTEAKGPKNHPFRKKIFKEALAKAKTPKQRQALSRILKPLAEIFGSVDDA